MHSLATARTGNHTDRTNQSAAHHNSLWQRTVQQNPQRLMRLESSDKKARAASPTNVSQPGRRLHDPLPRAANPLVTVGIGVGGQPAMTLIQRQPAATLPQAPVASVGVTPSGQVVSQSSLGTAQPTMSAAAALPPAVVPVAGASPVVQSGVASSTSLAPAAPGTEADSTGSGGGHMLCVVLVIFACSSLLIVSGGYIAYTYLFKPQPTGTRPKVRKKDNNSVLSTGHHSNSSTAGLNDSGHEKDTLWTSKLKHSTKDRPRNSHKTHVPSRSSGQKQTTPPASSTTSKTRDPQAATPQATEDHDF